MSNEVYTLQEHEKFTPTMIYTPTSIIWGNLLSPKTIRAEFWLKTTILPDYFSVHNGKMMIFSGAQPMRMAFGEIHIPVLNIAGIHVLPPLKPEIDYDTNEPNRAMAPVTALMGLYRFDGLWRISSLADLSTSLKTGKEKFTPLYEVTVSHPTAPSMKPMQIPYVLLRRELVIFTSQKKS